MKKFTCVVRKKQQLEATDPIDITFPTTWVLANYEHTQWRAVTRMLKVKRNQIHKLMNELTNGRMNEWMNKK